MNYIVVLPAAGSGKRMKAGHNKLFLTLRNKPILIHTLEVFEQDPNCAGIWLAVKPEERMTIQEMLERASHYKSKRDACRWRGTSTQCVCLHPSS